MILNFNTIPAVYHALYQSNYVCFIIRIINRINFNIANFDV